MPRTHRGAERFPGMTITYALIQMLEKVCERTDKARIITKANVKKLLTNSAGACIGCTYDKGGQMFSEYGPVILATGGFGADFTSTEIGVVVVAMPVARAAAAANATREFW